MVVVKDDWVTSTSAGLRFVERDAPYAGIDSLGLDIATSILQLILKNGNRNRNKQYLLQHEMAEQCEVYVPLPELEESLLIYIIKDAKNENK